MKNGLGEPAPPCYGGENKEEWEWLEANFPGDPNEEGTNDAEAWALFEKKLLEKFKDIKDI